MTLEVEVGRRKRQKTDDHEERVVCNDEEGELRQREAVRASALSPFLEYPDIGMERHLTLALIKCWVPRWKAFRIGGAKGAILYI